ncbi:MAG TPA: zinc ribbon domain-containing protein [Anaerolineales bacterium]|nr:zinc ribbon domain-containing protein [Anaerolineales bacterium]
MRKLFLILMLGVFFSIPYHASAQADITLSNVVVQLWPEYDQPSMLVLVDFQLSPNVSLPAKVTFRIPQGANLIAVAASSESSGFVTVPYEGPTADGDFQSFSMTIDETASYRFEFYDTLTFNGNQRLYTYLWDSSYSVDSFSVNMLEPLDVTRVSMQPDYASVDTSQGTKFYTGKSVKLAADEQYALTLDYEKTTNTLVSQAQSVQPAAPVDENTPGRVSLYNTLPYIIGGLGVVMILGGIVYYFRAGRAPAHKSRRRHSNTEPEDGGVDQYCPQCGSRAKASDRFCRTCGARLRHSEE